MSITDILTDPLRLTSMAVFALWPARSLYIRWQHRHYASIVRDRVRGKS